MSQTITVLPPPNNYGDIVADLRDLSSITQITNYDPKNKTVVFTRRPIEEVVPDLASEFILDHYDSTRQHYAYLNIKATYSVQRPPHVCTDRNGILEIRGSAGFIDVVNVLGDTCGFIYVKDRTKSYAMMPAGGVDASDEIESDGGYKATAFREVKEETGLDFKENVVEVGSWNFQGNFCGEKYPGTTKVFKFVVNAKCLPDMLRYTSDEIEEVIFVTREFLINNPVKNIDGKIIGPNITLKSGKQCELSPHHALVALVYLGICLDAKIPSYISNYQLAF